MDRNTRWNIQTRSIGSISRLFIGTLAVQNDQAWKRAEWVASEMQRFFDDPWVQVALTLVDWGSRPVRLPPGGEIDVIVTDDEIQVALFHHSLRTDGFTPKEVLIRDTFDHFLDGVERIASHVESKLVTCRALAPYLSYWAFHIQQANPKDHTVDRIVQLRKYAESYGY